MAYTPELTDQGSATLRRLAWFFGKPMTQTLEFLVEITARKATRMKPGAICEYCRDKSKCSICSFNPHETQIYDKGREVNTTS